MRAAQIAAGAMPTREGSCTIIRTALHASEVDGFRMPELLAAGPYAIPAKVTVPWKFTLVDVEAPMWSPLKAPFSLVDT